MKQLARLVIVAAALGLPGAAWPKGMPPERACGESACVQLDARPGSVIILDHDAMTPAPPVSGYYRLEYPVAGVGPHLFVPNRSRLAVETVGDRGLTWYALYGTGPEQLRQAIRELEPLARPERWPDSIEVGATTGPDHGFDFQPWMLGAILLALACAALLARRLSIRGPRTA